MIDQNQQKPTEEGCSSSRELQQFYFVFYPEKLLTSHSENHQNVFVKPIAHMSNFYQQSLAQYDSNKDVILCRVPSSIEVPSVLWTENSNVAT